MGQLTTHLTVPGHQLYSAALPQYLSDLFRTNPNKHGFATMINANGHWISFVAERLTVDPTDPTRLNIGIRILDPLGQDGHYLSVATCRNALQATANTAGLNMYFYQGRRNNDKFNTKLQKHIAAHLYGNGFSYTQS